MLTESVIEIGRPIVTSDLPNEQRIRWLTDSDDQKCKNFFQNILIVEVKAGSSAFHFVNFNEPSSIGSRRNSAFPVALPNGGNPLHAQGVYPLPCYLMYDRHIKAMNQPTFVAEKIISPRLKNTIAYRSKSAEMRMAIASTVAQELARHYSNFIATDKSKQLGILYIIDHSLPLFISLPQRENTDHLLWICESTLVKGEQIFLNIDQALPAIIESRFSEAKILGDQKNAVSTFSNQREAEVVSVYNKSWLWLSPTWELPRSIYWLSLIHISEPTRP